MQIDKASMRGPMEMESHNKTDKQKMLKAGKKSSAKKSAEKKSSSSSAKKKPAKKDDEKEKGQGVTLDEPSHSSSSASGVGDFIKDMIEIAAGAVMGNVIENIIDIGKDIVDQAIFGSGSNSREELNAGDSKFEEKEDIDESLRNFTIDFNSLHDEESQEKFSSTSDGIEDEESLSSASDGIEDEEKAYSDF